LTPEEVGKKIDGLIAKRTVELSKIATAARAVVPVLLDAGRTNSAKELQELFFQFDAIEQELHDVAMNNTSAMVSEFLRRAQKG
jgi:hypothetical protein